MREGIKLIFNDKNIYIALSTFKNKIIKNIDK